MSVVKPLAWSVVVLGMLGTRVHADPYLNGGSSTSYSWTTGWSQTWTSSPTSASGAADSATAAFTPPPPPPPAPTSPVAAPDPSTFSTQSAFVPTSVSAPTFTSNTGSSGGTADAYINFGSGPYAEASSLTVGTAQPWYTSPAVEKFFGGQAPNAQQQAAFENAVVQDIQKTYSLSGGMAPVLTTDPNVAANHTLSVVSGASYGANPNAIGITDVGYNGFSFIDKLNYATSLTDLEWAVAHNISHELMHAFGVAVHHDQTGQYLDAASATWSLLTDPNTTFSPDAISDIQSHNYGRDTGGLGALPGLQQIDGDLEIMATPVPEPTTMALWGLVAVGAVVHHRRSRRLAA
jgi:hypothetical protein